MSRHLHLTQSTRSTASHKDRANQLGRHHSGTSHATSTNTNTDTAIMPQLNFETDRRHAMAKRSVHLTATDGPANVTSEDCNVDLLPVSSFGQFPCDFDEGGAYYSGAAIPVRGLQIPGDQGYGDFATTGGRYHCLDPSELIAPSFRLGTACHAEFRQTKRVRILAVYAEDLNPGPFSSLVLHYVRQTPAIIQVSNEQFPPSGGTAPARIFDWIPETVGGPNNDQGVIARPFFLRNGREFAMQLPEWYSCDDVKMLFTTADFDAQNARKSAFYPNHIIVGDDDPEVGDTIERERNGSEAHWYFIIYPTTTGFDMQIWFTAGNDDGNGNWPVPSYPNGRKRESTWQIFYRDPNVTGIAPTPRPESIVVGWEASTTKQHLNDHLPVTFSLMPASELRGTNPFGAGQLTMNFSDVASPPLDAIDALNCFP